ncbi:MAG: hypothetical protein ACXW3C_07565 [Pyrinomonadaceae bacterium]
MKNYSLAKFVVSFLTVSFVVALIAVAASAQIRIGNVTIPTPRTDPKNPPNNTQPTTNPNSNRTQPNPNGNKTPTTPNANTRPTSTSNTKVETGPTREQVAEFRKDMEPYKQGMHDLMYMAKSKANNPSCREAQEVRRALTEGAAFLEIIKQKYPGIENPSWAPDHEDFPYNRVGDLRRWAENREEVAKNCVNQLLGAKVAEKVAGIESAIAEFDKREGYVLGQDSFDKAARHAELMEKYKEHYALVGITMPDDSVFAEYDAAHDRKVALANENAGKWVFPPTFHDAMIEAKARGWLKDRNPKTTVVKIGMLHGEWQVNHLSNGIPSGRYKRGYVMFRMPGSQNCLVTSFALEQNYVGGGRFNAEAITSGMQHSLRVQVCK